jgi:hypothetical protein
MLSQHLPMSLKSFSDGSRTLEEIFGRIFFIAGVTPIQKQDNEQVKTRYRRSCRHLLLHFLILFRPTRPE